eukprot:Amastigsp_a857933_13.p3 type:complete len:167 gc:universal Amastigsp_a857933_13:257-757(+)
MRVHGAHRDASSRRDFCRDSDCVLDNDLAITVRASHLDLLRPHRHVANVALRHLELGTDLPVRQRASHFCLVLGLPLPRHEQRSNGDVLRGNRAGGRKRRTPDERPVLGRAALGHGVVHLCRRLHARACCGGDASCTSAVDDADQRDQRPGSRAARGCCARRSAGS